MLAPKAAHKIYLLVIFENTTIEKIYAIPKVILIRMHPPETPRPEMTPPVY